ncbi:MAG: hypothetical protein OES57_00220 [Acidimicrobiia bacterium]|nr:hypothetical protein [Acidimicrobiia bacterium]
MKKKIAAAIFAGALFGGVGLAGTAGAAEPANQACIGDLFGGFASENGGPVPGAGEVVAPIAQNPEQFGLNSFGDAIQALQAGAVPDEVQPNSCND